MSYPAPQRNEPTVWQKMKMGALMGGGVGLTIGFIFGSFTILRQGAGPRGFVATLSQYMLSSAATFGFFLSIGSVIRNDTDGPLPLTHLESMRMHAHLIPAELRSRAQGAAMIQDRWEAEKVRFAREREEGEREGR